MNFGVSNILFKYLAKNFLVSFLVVFICFFFITSLLEGMEIVRRASYGYIIPNFIIFKLILLRTISTISLFFPFVIFISTILFYIMVNNKLELTSIRIFAISPIQIIKCICFTTFLLGIFYISVFDTISALSADKVKKIERIVFNKLKPENTEVTITNSGMWFKDKTDEGNYIIYARSFDRNSNSLANIRFFQFDNNSEFKQSIHSSTTKIQDGMWYIKNAITITATGEQIKNNLITIPTKLSLNNVNKMTTDPKSISIWNITKYINMLEKVGLSTTRYKLQLYIQISSIIQMIAFVLLASIFCMSYNSRNMRSYSLKVIFALVIAFPLHFLNSLLTAFGANETISPILATIALPSSLVATFLFYFKNDFI